MKNSLELFLFTVDEVLVGVLVWNEMDGHVVVRKVFFRKVLSKVWETFKD